MSTEINKLAGLATATLRNILESAEAPLALKLRAAQTVLKMADEEEAPAAEAPVEEPVQPYRREEPKTGRNAPCPCGSTFKFKRCCGNPLNLPRAA